MNTKERSKTTRETSSGNGRTPDIVASQPLLLPAERLETVAAWGGATKSLSYVYRPSTVAQMQEIFALARRSGRSIGLRGAGQSYGDAALNSENIILDSTRLNRILDWNPETGIIEAEAGATIGQLWQYILEDGWWPPIVSGTMKPTLGGAAGMNIHGKNAWKMGTIGDHILEFDLLLASGEIVTCSRQEQSDLFHAAIGGFGMLGCITRMTMQMKRIYSGLLTVDAIVSRSMDQMLAQFDEHLPTSDYLVGWVDGFGRGKGLGRGQIHKATYLPPGADPYPSQTLRLDFQNLPENVFGVLPRSIMWLLMRPFMNNLGARFVNLGKYYASVVGDGKRIQQSHAAFHFLLDYIPNWKWSYGRGGLIQYQSFIPTANAGAAYKEILARCLQRGLPNYLGVLKKHKPDDFLISYGLDGYSLAMDFRVTPRRLPELLKLTRELDEIVLQANGRFYLAKDSVLRPAVFTAFLGEEPLNRFKQLKQQYDPDNILQTNLWRRLVV